MCALKKAVSKLGTDSLRHLFEEQFLHSSVEIDMNEQARLLFESTQFELAGKLKVCMEIPNTASSNSAGKHDSDLGNDMNSTCILEPNKFSLKFDREYSISELES